MVEVLKLKFSDRSLVKCKVFFDCVKLKSAFGILIIHCYVINSFWANAQSTKFYFQTLQQWWEFVKAQIKQLCQQMMLHIHLL